MTPSSRWTRAGICDTLFLAMKFPTWKTDRRGLFRHGGLAALAGLFGSTSAAAPAGSASNIYTALGVRPLINCKGTFTIITGSLILPEVKRAMDEAANHYVHLDELMDAVGRRLGELTKAEWGIVTAGCAAALTHATAACLAGTDPEKIQRLPYLTGLKSEVIVPRHSRNVYDQAIRMLGVRMVEVNTAEEFEAAFNEKTAMVMVLASPAADSGPLSTENICRIARTKHVPVLVDAAAEHLTIPSIHLERGAHMVAYSGGKCIRGPQCAGLLLGEKKLLQAAWINSAPHHAFGRSLKVGKEEIMGMLAAVEAWTRRDHDAEWRMWESWLNHIAARVTRIDGVTTETLQPRGLSNRAPQLRIQWDGAKLGITGEEVEKLLYNSDPRIIFGSATGSRRGEMASSLTIMPYMMTPDDHKIVAERIHAVLSKPPKAPPLPSFGPPANLAGQWDLHIDFLLGSADHNLVLEQQGADLVGTHRGEITRGDLRGVVEGNEVRFRSSHRYEGTTLHYEFAGQLSGDTIRGRVGLGEYGEAEWVATRHRYPAPGRKGARG
jgi:uncharacterized pyridoxal phosphate-dependent enzyme